MGFAQRFKQAMENKSITAYRLAKELGVHQTTIKNWVDGKGEPHLNQLKQIAKILDADIIYLISGQTSAEVERGILIQAKNEAEFLLSIEEAEFHTQMNTALGNLNFSGKREAVKRVEELQYVPEYRAETAPQSTIGSTEGTDTTPPADAPTEVPERE